MAKKQDRQEPEKRKPGRPQERVKLPLPFDEALRGLLATKPDGPSEKGSDQEKRRDDNA